MHAAGVLFFDLGIKYMGVISKFLKILLYNFIYADFGTYMC